MCVCGLITGSNESNWSGQIWFVIVTILVICFVNKTKMSTAEKELENCPTLEEIDEKLKETEKEFQETREEVEKLHVNGDCHYDQAESYAKSKLNIGGKQCSVELAQGRESRNMICVQLCCAL